ncbi:hypothetical protein PAF17_09410 [Paracoccus sp. Z330]|uniref:Uncharacterized protein n=1 Tax=Paracoccus onchidii TaxID=3017813 RepID=A0ABT4ZEE9_9RHOB|nr:potassium transporter TrkG [Paracoccus onchidii]MDB6177727.1 hypothetical protein [Paracoccus onchidii]
MKALDLTTVSILLVLTAIFVMLIDHDGQFIDLVFEVTSAFGTVGLSRGTTGELDDIGRAGDADDLERDVSHASRSMSRCT